MESKKFNFGILSTAGITSKLLPAFIDSSKTEVVAVASRSVDKAKEWADENKLKDIQVYGSYEELLEDKNVECVYLPIPTGLKFEWATKCAKAGKHILVEKPLCGDKDTKQLQELLQCCKQNKVQFMDCTMFLHAPRTTKIQEMIKNQEFGQVKKINANFIYNGGEDFFKNDIRMDPKLEPLGILGDLLWYSCMAALVSFNFEAPKKVQAVQWKTQKDALIESAAILHFSDNRIAFIDAAFTEDFRNNWEIGCVNGVMRVNRFGDGSPEDGKNETFERFKEAAKLLEVTKEGKLEKIDCKPCDQVVNMVETFVGLIEKKDESQHWGNITLLNQRVIAHVFNSIQKNGATLDYDSNL